MHAEPTSRVSRPVGKMPGYFMIVIAIYAALGVALIAVF